MGERSFGPSSKGPRKVPSVAAYDRVVEALSKCSRTGRIRLQSRLVDGKNGDELLIEKFKAFKQSAVSGQVKLKVEYRDKHYADDGKVLSQQVRVRYEIDICRDEGLDRPEFKSKRVGSAVRCTCRKVGETVHTGMMDLNGAITKTSVDRRGCPMHDASKRPMFRRLVCQCGTSYVPQGRFQDTCKACWEIGESRAGRIFGPSAHDE